MEEGNRRKNRISLAALVIGAGLFCVGEGIMVKAALFPSNNPYKNSLELKEDSEQYSQFENLISEQKSKLDLIVEQSDSNIKELSKKEDVLEFEIDNNKSSNWFTTGLIIYCVGFGTMLANSYLSRNKIAK